jgi:hypothetical protein
MPVEPRGTAHLRERLHDLARSVAYDDLREAGQRTARTERQAGYLALLAVYARILTSLQANIDSAVTGAYAAGATFAEIGRAAGMTRQAARQKWLQLTTKPAATNSDDPRHGQRDIHDFLGPSPLAEPTSRPGDTKPRVHEVAAELGLTSKQVLRDLARMGEYVKSASSRLEPTVARKLCSMHQPPR